jgi:hypothetical protein
MNSYLARHLSPYGLDDFHYKRVIPIKGTFQIITLFAHCIRLLMVAENANVAAQLGNVRIHRTRFCVFQRHNNLREK